jgi:BirA family biotin operon repressor/biotin-[acetyl-CoA-carboxylase] ligase
MDPRGYKLLSSPDRLMGEDILSLLKKPSLIREIVVFEETGSTNDVAARLGDSGAPEGVVIFAEKQTSGRGRLGRRWESAAARGLWFSLLLRPGMPLRDWTRLTTWAAVAVAQGIEDATSAACRAAIKWPNDIYVDGLKIAGTLLGTQIDSAGRHFAVVGIGVNINQEAADFPEALRFKAGSLRMVLGRFLDRQAVAGAILQRLDATYSAIRSEFPEMVAAARGRSCLLGCRVEIAGGETRETGTVEGLNDEGALLIRRADGTQSAILGGEVSVTGWNGPGSRL